MKHPSLGSYSDEDLIEELKYRIKYDISLYDKIQELLKEIY